MPRLHFFAANKNYANVPNTIFKTLLLQQKFPTLHFAERSYRTLPLRCWYAQPSKEFSRTFYSGSRKTLRRVLTLKRRMTVPFSRNTLSKTLTKFQKKEETTWFERKTRHQVVLLKPRRHGFNANSRTPCGFPQKLATKRLNENARTPRGFNS